MRRGQQMFMDYVNTERMGVTVNGLKYGVFFSHQWLAWAEPDPDGTQYNEMVAACLALCEKNGYDPTNVYIFLDILSIPQVHTSSKQQQAAPSPLPLLPSSLTDPSTITLSLLHPTSFPAPPHPSPSLSLPA